MNSNRSGVKNSQSDRPSVGSSVRVQPFTTDRDGVEIKHNMKKTKPAKRLKTLDPYIDLQESKEKCLSKLYGMQVS